VIKHFQSFLVPHHDQATAAGITGLTDAVDGKEEDELARHGELRVSGGLVSPPATPRKKTVRSRRHSGDDALQQASADEPPSAQTGTEEKGKEGANKKAKVPKEKEKKDGWTAVERGQSQESKKSRDRGQGGVTTFRSR